MGAGQPVQDRTDVREFQLNMDGQQVTQNMGTGAAAVQPCLDCGVPVHLEPLRRQPGPLIGVQVNAVTKSGTNRLGGTFFGNFRDSDWNAEDPVLNVKRPYQEPAVQRDYRRSHRHGSPPLLRQLRVQTVPRRRASGTRRIRRSTCPSAGSRPRRWAAAAWTTSWRPARD